MAYTRLTMIGSNRKADLVLPDDEPVGALLPQLLEVLDERIPGDVKSRLPRSRECASNSTRPSGIRESTTAR